MSPPNPTRRRVLAAGVSLAASASFPGRVGAIAPAKADVLILGAGMAGLHAARILKTAGVDVLVLEGSPRIGGRCWTQRDVPGRAEFGALEIGRSYGRVRGNAAELGIALADFPAWTAAQKLPPAISLRGKPVVAAPWATSPINRLAEAEKTVVPSRLGSHYLGARPLFADLADWQKPEFAALDALSLRQWLSTQGASAEAMRLIDVTVAARSLDEANALEALRKNHFYLWEAKTGTSQRIVDGTDALTTAMAASLDRAPATNRVVTRIAARPKDVRVTCADGSTYDARACICTIPLPLMRSIAVDGPVPAVQRAAWRSIRYGQLVQVLAHVDAPFWERDGMSPDLWSDSAIERMFYLAPRDDATGDHGDLIAYVNGRATDRLDRMTPAAIGDAFLRTLARIRPAAAPAVHVTHVHDWTTHPFSKGHVATFAPGDYGRYFAALTQPVGALHFAGEHCGRLHSGLEAACESAETAALAILDAIDRA